MELTFASTPNPLSSGDLKFDDDKNYNKFLYAKKGIWNKILKHPHSLIPLHLHLPPLHHTPQQDTYETLCGEEWKYPHL